MMHSQTSPTVQQLVTAMAIGAILGVCLVLLAGSHAEAAPPSNCRNADYDTQARQGSQSGNHQGLKANTWLGAVNGDCGRITAHTVINGNGFFEYGWILGWDFCGAANNYRDIPFGFVAYAPINGSYNCIDIGTMNNNVWRNMAVRDQNSDTVWGAYKDGVQVHQVNLNFDRGTGFTLGERKNTSDTAFAHFKALQWMVAGNQSWLNFSDLDPGPDDDPTHYCVHISNTEQRVHTVGTGCTN